MFSGENEETKRRKMKRLNKKHKKKSKKKASSSDSDSQSEELEWVEAPQPTPSFQAPRDEWMSAETFVPTVSKEEIQAKNRKDKGRSNENPRSLSTIDKPGQHERELNPYWKNNGQGVPMDNSESSGSSSVRLPASSVGDGGLSWLRKAYRRVQQQAEEEGRTMEEVAVERWGSLENLEVMLAEAEKRNRNESSHYSRESMYRSRVRESCLERHRPVYNKSLKDACGSREKDFDRIKESVHKKVSEAGHSKIRSRDESYASLNKTDFKSMFRKPQEPLNECQQTRTSTNSTHIPAWMKKEYSKVTPCKKDISELSDTEIDRKIVSIDQKIEENFEVTSKLKQHENSPVLTDNEMNTLAAKILKAEIIGNDVLALQLKDQLEAARKVRGIATLQPCPRYENKEQEEILLTKTDYRGISRPLYAPQQFESPSSGKKKMQKDRYDAGSKRAKYLPDDSKYSLKEMFTREKLTTAEDQIEMYVDIAKECKESTTQDYDMDDVSGKVIKKMGQYRQEEKDIGKAIWEHKRLSAALDKCQYCLDGPHMKKHLMITVTNKTYLCLPSYQSLTDGHCLIVPKSHVPSTTLLDEDEWNEIQALKRCVMKMFEDEGQCVVFIETSMNLRYCPHAVIEGIPMPKETGELAPLYFKKAIQESESEWAHNQKLVDLFKKDIRHSVPKGLPYFCVEFGLNGGYAHVIEDEKRFPKSFGKEVIGGMMDLESPLLRKEKSDSFKEQSKKVLKFSQLWKPYEHHIKSYL